MTEEKTEKPLLTLNEINDQMGACVDKVVKAAREQALEFVRDLKEIFVEIDRLPPHEQKAATALFVVTMARFNREQDAINELMETEFSK